MIYLHSFTFSASTSFKFIPSVAGRFRRSFAVRYARRQVDPGRNHFLRIRMRETRLSWRLHEALVLSAVDQSEDTHAATLTRPDPSSVLPNRPKFPQVGEIKMCFRLAEREGIYECTSSKWLDISEKKTKLLSPCICNSFQYHFYITPSNIQPVKRSFTICNKSVFH